MDSGGSPATSAGAIIGYVLAGYILVLSCIVVSFCFCFVRFNCRCVECCDSRYCRRCTYKLKLSRKLRVQCPKCPACVRRYGEEAEGRVCGDCCSCCDNERCDSDAFTFWGEIVILGILCLPLALILLILFAKARS